MPHLRLLQDVADFIYPPRCASCGSGDGTGQLCDRCTMLLDALSATPSCGKCAMPLAQSGDPCPYCLGRGPQPFSRIIALGPFKDPLRGMIHQIKYHHSWPLAEALADRLAGLEQTRNLLKESDRLIAVPLHWSRQISRGYNQAQVIAARLTRGFKCKLCRPIVRWKKTQPQTATHARDRRVENLRDAFALINPKSIRGKNVVLVDDVMTTVATLRSAGRVIMEAEPASLSAIVLAVADPKRREFQTI